MSSEHPSPTRYPHGSGSGDEDDYSLGKKEKIIMCCMVGFCILALYQLFQIQNEIKITDWTLDPNTHWTCTKLNSYEKMVTNTLSAVGEDFPKQLEQQIAEKRGELNC